jgi:hypothetical protein
MARSSYEAGPDGISAEIDETIRVQVVAELGMVNRTVTQVT